MIDTIWKELKAEKNVRKNLIELRTWLKQEGNQYAFFYHYEKEFSVLISMFTDSDPKVRKNTAVIMGILKKQDFLEPLIQAYKNETTLFVRSAYLTAIKQLDYTKYKDYFSSHLEQLRRKKIEETEEKHISEEIRVLSDLVLDENTRKVHTFTGYCIPTELILLTNRNFKSVTLEQLTPFCDDIIEMNAGIKIKTNQLKEVERIRTYSDMLFLMPDCKVVELDPEKAAKKLSQSSMISFLTKLHSETIPFYFRVELKSNIALQKKGIFIKKFAMLLEQYTNCAFINTASAYEIEIRLIETKSGKLNVLFKLYTKKDNRFSYRKHAVAASIQPVNAALTMQLAKPYLKEKARVLDPFCGVGTMLIERQKCVKADTLYGIDKFGKAIDMARENTDLAGLIIHYVNRDYFDFTHEYLFDEIVTNMPMETPKVSKKELFLLYRQFFEKTIEQLADNGIVILYTHNREFTQKGIEGNYELLKEYEISKVEGSYVEIFRVHKS